MLLYESEKCGEPWGDNPSLIMVMTEHVGWVEAYATAPVSEKEVLMQLFEGFQGKDVSAHL